jgi:hypothetical protein
MLVFFERFIWRIKARPLGVVIRQVLCLHRFFVELVLVEEKR